MAKKTRTVRRMPAAAGEGLSLDGLVADARFHSLAYAIDDAVVVTDPDNLVLFANPAADRLLQVVPGGLMGVAFALPLPSLKSGPAELELATGQRCPVQMTLSATVWDGSIAHLATLRPLRGAEATADSEALAAMRARFLGHLSHELRTPLNTVLGFSETMARELFGPLGSARYKAYAEDINRAGERLNMLLADLLDLSRAETGDLALQESVFDLADLIDALLPAVQAEAKRNARAQGAALSAAHEGTVLLRGDRDKLSRAIGHLLSNGLAFTPADGRVDVSTKLSSDGRLFIRVADTGRGFSAEELAHAFQPFPQVRHADHADPQAGPGVGLALVRRYVELHGGAVRIDSSSGEGTTVTCIIPPERVALDLAGRVTRH